MIDVKMSSNDTHLNMTHVRTTSSLTEGFHSFSEFGSSCKVIDQFGVKSCSV